MPWLRELDSSFLPERPGDAPSDVAQYMGSREISARWRSPPRAARGPGPERPRDATRRDAHTGLRMDFAECLSIWSTTWRPAPFSRRRCSNWEPSPWMERRQRRPWQIRCSRLPSERARSWQGTDNGVKGGRSAAQSRRRDCTWRKLVTVASAHDAAGGGSSMATRIGRIPSRRVGSMSLTSESPTMTHSTGEQRAASKPA